MMTLLKTENTPFSAKSLKSAVFRSFFVVTLVGAFPLPSKALEGHFKGAVFWQDSAQNLPNEADGLDKLGGSFDARLKQQWFKDQWTFALDYQLSGSDSYLNTITRTLSPYYDQPDRAQLFNLTDIIKDSGRLFSYQRLDRLNATYNAANYSIKFGRQVMSWGSGQVFNPLDRINPFAPNQIDKSYKPGLDMLSGQRYLNNGDELNWFILPRRELATEELTHDASSYGFKLYHFGQNADYQWILAKDAREQLFGWEVTVNRENGLWNLDFLWSYDSEHNRHYYSAVGNWQNSFELFSKQTIAFAELYYNGYGSTESRPKIEQLPAQLQLLQSNGKTFVSNRLYSAVGATIELDPLWNLSPTLISNLQDGSHLLSLNLQVSLSDNDLIITNWQEPIGRRGSEFTGLESDLSPGYSSYSRQLFFQWQHFFAL